MIFTAPRPVTLFAMVNPKVLYPLILRAGAEAVLELGRTWEGLRAWMALLALLHTWGQLVNLHVHSHNLVPAGGLSLDGKRWVGLPEGTTETATGGRRNACRAWSLSDGSCSTCFHSACATSGGSASWRRAWRPRSSSRFARYWECQRSEAELCQRPQATAGWVTATCKATRMRTCRTPINQRRAAAGAVDWHVRADRQDTASHGCRVAAHAADDGARGGEHGGRRRPRALRPLVTPWERKLRRW